MKFQTRFSLVITVLLATSLHAFADGVVLPPMNEPEAVELPIDPDAEVPSCDQIMDRLTQYQQVEQQHSFAVSDYLSGFSSKLLEWNSVLLPLEGTTQTIADGTFQVLVDGADRVDMVNGFIADNNTLLGDELDKIISGLRACKLTPAQ
jgi:hypothetical protein